MSVCEREPRLERPAGPQRTKARLVVAGFRTDLSIEAIG